MIAEIINTGSELLSGYRLNTHQQWLCRQLVGLGCRVTRQTSVPDDGASIETILKEALARADLVLTTGGLGPTSDDVTRERAASLLGRRLHEAPAIVEHIRAFFTARGRAMPDRVRVQALVPEGASVLPNRFGTAPGLVLDVNPNPLRPGASSLLIMLPGPPRELYPMFTDQVAPILRAKHAASDQIASRILRTTGLGESLVEQRLENPLAPWLKRGLELGLCASPGEVDIHLTARGPDAALTVAEAAKTARAVTGEHVYGEGEEELEQVIVRLLKERGQTLALAESCTGGHIANRITDVPGASQVLLAGLVAYSNAAKERFLGVKAASLAAHGAVSEAVAREMAIGAHRHTGADHALAVTGIAGPSGGSPDKPAGTVFIALADKDGAQIVRNLNPFDRSTFKRVTSQQALEMLRRKLTGLPACVG